MHAYIHIYIDIYLHICNIYIYTYIYIYIIYLLNALFRSMQVIGDLYPTMIVRQTFRHIQYAILAKQGPLLHLVMLDLLSLLDFKM
jgi:hypothetical protein